MTPLAVKDGFTLIDELLEEQRQLTAVERFAFHHENHALPAEEKFYRNLLPARSPVPGEQYAFAVDLDACSGCKACVTACHNLNGLDESESWRQIGLLHSRAGAAPFLQTVTTACHHCVDPACLNGCPVLAYDKDAITGIVRHLDDQCMGCQYCVMKCPYEVPQYSSRLGIVRKCDMCAGRLASGQLTACAQACPNNAISITLVNKANVQEAFRDESVPRTGSNCHSFLPDSPDPQITLPTTRFVSRRPLPREALAANHGVPRLENPHWPLVFMLVLTQMAAGMFLYGALEVKQIGPAIQYLYRAAFCALVLGLTASIFHLGQPLKAWRAFLGWRTSWLSREIIVMNAFVATAALATIAPRFLALASRQVYLNWVVAGIGFAAVITSAMVYVDTRRPLWSPRFTFGNFLGTTLLLGATFTGLIVGWVDQARELIQTITLIATAFRTGLFLWRESEIRNAFQDASSPIHFNSCIIRELLSWIRPVQTMLFAGSTLFGLLAIGNVAQGGTWWLTLAAMTTFSSEIIARYVFFAGGASKRMPGGIAA